MSLDLNAIVNILCTATLLIAIFCHLAITYFRDQKKTMDKATMSICGHIIKLNEIVGIGPLMVQRSADQTTFMIYGSRKIWFILHLRSQSVKIESDWCATRGYDKEVLEADKKKYSIFSVEYEISRRIIVKMLNGGKGLPAFMDPPPVAEEKATQIEKTVVS
jgi:hypothetical protein